MGNINMCKKINMRDIVKFIVKLFSKALQLGLIIVALIFIFAVIGYVFWRCPETGISCQSSEVLLKNWHVILIFGTSIALVVFGVLIYMGYLADKSLSKGEMRRAIAGTFVIGLQMLLILSVIFNVYTEKVITAYLTAMTMILGFYFGSRTAQQTQQETLGLVIENVHFGKDDKKKKITVSVRNLTPQEVNIDVVYVNKSPQKREAKVSPGEIEHINVEFNWEEGKSYEIIVGTKEGLKAETKVKAPGGEQNET